MNRAVLIVAVIVFIASSAPAQNTPDAVRQNNLRIVSYDAVQRHGEQTERYVQKMINNWKQTKDADEREKIEKSLRDALTKEFEVRLAAHEREIKNLEEKVRQLRERLALRKEKQTDIVEHRMQQILRDAQGLGWGTDAATSYARPSYFVSEQQPITPYVVPAPARQAPPGAATSVFRPNPTSEYAVPDDVAETQADESPAN
jgi:hypothetical protein